MVLKKHPVVSCHQYRKGHPLYHVVNKIPRCIVIRYIVTLLMYALQWWPSWISKNGYFVDRGLSNKNSTHVCFQMVQWFQRISLKYFPHRVLCKFWENTIITSRVIPLWLTTLKFLSLLLKSSLISVNFVISDEKNICIKLMSCGGGHLGFLMHTKKISLFRGQSKEHAFTGIQVSENNFKFFPMWWCGPMVSCGGSSWVSNWHKTI